MTCYVDAIRSYPDAGLRHTDFCHLLADTREELWRFQTGAAISATSVLLIGAKPSFAVSTR